MIVDHLTIQMSICPCAAHSLNMAIVIPINSNALMVNASMHHWLAITTTIVVMLVMKLDVVNTFHYTKLIHFEAR